MSNVTTRMPEAFISASNKNRLKIYNGKNVYLKDGEEFQIELFNPTPSTVGVKIYLNGNSISSQMLVLKPGSRNYLERFIDDNKKFLYETYQVEDSKEVKDAIADNGDVKIEFYNEYVPAPYYFINTYVTNPTLTISTPPFPYGTFYYGTTTGTGTVGSGITYTSDSNGILNVYSSSSTFDGTSGTISVGNMENITSGSNSTNIGSAATSSTTTNSLETGRIEKGSSSDQSFNSYYGSFNTYSFHSIEYKILPESVRPIEIKEIRKYCTSCRTRIKKSSWKYCPSCGEHLD